MKQLKLPLEYPYDCDKCDGEGWLWWNELDDYSGPGIETGCDDTRYPCDKCGGKGHNYDPDKIG